MRPLPSCPAAAAWFAPLVPTLGLTLALTGGSAVTAQSGPPPAVQWLTAEDLAPRLEADRPWVGLIDRSTLSVGRYRLRAGATDGQQPHDRDEVYYVLTGKAQFTAAGETRAVGAGDTLFLATGTKHHFHDIEEDLDLLVFFSSAVPTTGGMAAGPRPTEQTPYPETSSRGAARIFYWYGPDSAGQLVIDHGRPRWHRRYEQFLQQPSDKRWRFGDNFWTRLDTNIPIVLGGQRVQPGSYYCAIQHAQNGLELVLLNPQDVRAGLRDAYEASKTSGGLPIPLQREDAEYSASRLAISWQVDRSQRDKGQLRIHYGLHVLTADLTMAPVRDRSQLAAPAADPTDVASVDAIVKALYGVISGPAGQKRDWQRLRSLFHQDAQLVPIVATPSGKRSVVMSVADYIARSGPMLEKNGFFEQEIARKVETFGAFAHVWSTYEGRRKQTDEQPMLRGINSIQLVHENDRWYVMRVLWEQEATAGKIPAKYLPAK